MKNAVIAVEISNSSFFYGAMYVSYGLNVAVGIAAFIISYLVFNSSLKLLLLQ
jgi:hypothetical protein